MEKKLKKGKKVTVLGAGNVGASIAFALAIKGLCSELLLIDINKPKAKGEAYHRCPHIPSARKYPCQRPVPKTRR